MQGIHQDKFGHHRVGGGTNNNTSGNVSRPASYTEYGPAALYRDTRIFPSVRRAVPTGPLLYSDVWTGNCDPRSLRQAYNAAKFRCQPLLSKRTGEYLSCINAYASAAINAAGCEMSRDMQTAGNTFAQSPPRHPLTADELVQRECMQGDDVFPSAASQQACVARYKAVARDGFTRPQPVVRSDDPWSLTNTDYAMSGKQPSWALFD